MRNWKHVCKAFVVGVKDFRITEELKSFLKDFPVSGAALFNSPSDSPDNIWKDRESSLEALYEFNQRLLDSVDFIAVDQEGGRVRRLRGAFVRLPSAQTMAEACQDPALIPRAKNVYQLAARQMALSGIRVNFAPVCDLRTETSNSVVGDRSFGTRVETVKKWAELFCSAFRSESVAVTLKHFPGHGPSRFDSHEKIATIEKDLKDYQREDTQIFYDLAAYADLLMTGHLGVPEHEAEVFSLDSKLMGEYLKPLKPPLPLITDDLLSMKAVSSLKPWLKALEGPYQYILLCGDLSQAVSAIEESIRYAESSFGTFEKQQALEKRTAQAAELFKTSWSAPRFTDWRSQILDCETKANDLLHQLGIFSHA